MSALYSFYAGLLLEARVGTELAVRIENMQVIDSVCARTASSYSAPKVLAQISTKIICRCFLPIGQKWRACHFWLGSSLLSSCDICNFGSQLRYAFPGTPFNQNLWRE